MELKIRDGTPDWGWNSRLGMGLKIRNGTPDWGSKVMRARLFLLILEAE